MAGRPSGIGRAHAGRTIGSSTIASRRRLTRSSPEGERAAEHLRIGRLLAAQTPPEAIAEHVFEIVGQLNRGAALIGSPEEREQLAELNLMAGQRAIASTAYASALTYLAAGARAVAPG